MGWIYLTGGRQSKRRASSEAALFDHGVILRINDETGDCEVCVEYRSPPELTASSGSATTFKGGTITDEYLYVCTNTEVVGFRLPSFEPALSISLPWFNDLHHVAPSARGTLLIVNTGLDMVMETSLEGDVLEYWSVVETDVWSRFSKDVDYRKVPTTKPHASHPNYVFELNGDVWVTRFNQKDAVSLQDRRSRIPLSIERPHDGSLKEDKVFFTTIDGHVVTADAHSHQVDRVVSLQELGQEDDDLGWCRGLRVDGETIWVGFSRLRPTKFQENVAWVKHGFKATGYGVMPTRVCCYDLAEKRLLKTLEVEAHGLNTIFSVL